MANHFTNTPEALLGRNDSKNAASTCRGITSNGRPCRRALASAKLSSSSSSSSGGGVVAVVEEDGAVTNAEFYCWQHKDQAQLLQQDSPGKRPKKKRTTELYPLQERSSIDTLVQKLGIEAMPDNIRNKAKTRPNGGVKPPRRTSTADFAEKQGLARPPPKKAGFWASLCCASGQEEEDHVEIVRHKKRMEQKHSSNPQTGHLLSLIPQDLSPQVTSTLLAELVKPISPADEDGYIYIFWLTPQSMDGPAQSTARSLLSPPSDRGSSRRISDVMTEFSFDGAQDRSRGARPGRGKKTIMLKIGRANNVTRRMNEWQRQCGYALNLVRWYPHVSSTPSPSPANTPRKGSNTGTPDRSRPASSRGNSGNGRKVHFVKRVERLIHLELADQQVKKHCEACGKEHREWFEVEASEEGVRNVDACVKRWVEWADREVAN
ncbi:hypothetical protein CERZMDRAFT_48766 [Cercospora zeae-maydis SCOH1-5]|uniref:Bacteriophage T5 Orf172 DNA-binding domain-containing protein n=1 Tax=Cercospora zeae-maydis SCOH1-5 TaxID=717836 RepID=A0A6A6F5K2_9PEZI|nr:hypothetical protein CERZMDRAFT_48766 [Cercospora zeae-maydis SCOH1-5]